MYSHQSKLNYVFYFLRAERKKKTFFCCEGILSEIKRREKKTEIMKREVDFVNHNVSWATETCVIFFTKSIYFFSECADDYIIDIWIRNELLNGKIWSTNEKCVRAPLLTFIFSFLSFIIQIA